MTGVSKYIFTFTQKMNRFIVQNWINMVGIFKGLFEKVFEEDKYSKCICAVDGEILNINKEIKVKNLI